MQHTKPRPPHSGLIQQAATWRLLATLFERPRHSRCREVVTLAAEVARNDLRRAANQYDSFTEAQYIEALGPGGLVSPREVAYRGREDPGRILADITTFHEVFVFRSESEDPPDHVARECDFVAYLLLKEAYARSQENHGAADICASGRERFVEEHLQCFAAPFAKAVEGCAHPVLTPAARALHALVGDPQQPPVPEVESDSGAGDFDCGECAL